MVAVFLRERPQLADTGSLPAEDSYLSLDMGSP